MVEKLIKDMDGIDQAIHSSELRAPILSSYINVNRKHDEQKELKIHQFFLPIHHDSLTVHPAELALGLLIVVMSRYTEQKSLLFSYRNSEQKENGILGVDLSDDLSFQTLIERIFESDLKQDSSSLLGDDPLTVRFSFGNHNEPWTLAPLAYEQQDVPVQMDVQFILDEGQLSGTVVYNGKLFKESFILRFISHMETVLMEVRDKGTLPISTLKLVSKQEENFLKKWGRIDESFAQQPSVHQLFEAQVEKTPYSIALSFQGKEITYQQLNERAEALANRLAEMGVGPDRVVVILAERSFELVEALLGILKAGGCYLALESNIPKSRLDYILADATPHVILAQDQFWDRIPEGKIPKLRLNCERTFQFTKQRSEVNIKPEHLAYISYTSGSTGTPKGVCVPHKAVSRLVYKSDFLTASSSDVYLSLSPVAFDASTLEIWAPLANGGRLAIFDPAPVTLDRLAETIQMEEVTTLWLTSGLFHLMVDAHIEVFAGVKHVLAGGDVISRVHLERLLTAHPDLTFTNGYGPTENTTFTTCWTTKQRVQEGSIPIGMPINGTGVVILDDNLQLVPVGVQGELYALGAGLARCYLNNPTETARKFISVPFTSDPEEKMYKTGDLARWREDGTIEFLGRADFQVKIYGYRVELGEVEAAILQYEDVKEAAVVVQSDHSSGKRLLAYVVLHNTQENYEVKMLKLQAFLKGYLPPYMVPWAIIPIHEIPLNVNGKVDRSKLPSEDRVPRRLNTVYNPPRNQTEAYLAQLWGELLAVEPVGIHDNFFLMGGNSLTLAEMTLEVQKKWGEVPSRVLYLKPTISELASFIMELKASD
ncbi:non-ribosomal peptide synthetase [Kroppenstedtia pulmonis]|nr:non-ribosomal peptide synthetase [Kroppenstedtia pulmonis]